MSSKIKAPYLQLRVRGKKQSLGTHYRKFIRLICMIIEEDFSTLL